MKEKINSDYLSDIKIKNFSVNRNNKNLFRRNLALVAAGIVGFSAFFGYKSIKNKANIEKDRQAVVEYYGEESEESYALNYLDIKSELESLNLDSYNIDSKLIEKLNLTYDLSNPTKIKEKIEEFKKSIKSDDKDLTSKYDFISNVIFLRDQRDLLDGYIDSKIHPKIYVDLTTSLKEYAAEKYNLDIPSNIFFTYRFEKSDGGITLIMEYSQAYSNYKCVVTDKNIVEGVKKMVEMQNVIEKKIPVNERLQTYITALKMASDLKKEVVSKDLYDENLENKLKNR